MSVLNSNVHPSEDFESRLAELRGWLVLLARIHLDARFRGHEASDIAQDALVDAVKYRGKVESLPAQEFEHWLRRVLRNKVIDFYRRHRAHIAEADLHRVEADICDSFLRLDALAVASQSSPSERYAKGEEQRRLADAMERLSPEYREVVVLKDLAGWPLRQIAEHLGCSIGTIAGRLRRARGSLYAMLEQPDD